MSSPDGIPAAIRAELNTTPAWWDHEYQTLIRKQIPRDAASHADHDIDRLESWAGTTIAVRCVTCGVSIDDYAGGPDG